MKSILALPVLASSLAGCTYAPLQGADVLQQPDLSKTVISRLLPTQNEINRASGIVWTESTAGSEESPPATAALLQHREARHIAGRGSHSFRLLA